MPLQEHYTYEQVKAILGDRRMDRIGSNTYAAMPTDGSPGQIDITLHRTQVATLYPNGVVRINSDGYRTKVTADRIRRFLPAGWALGAYAKGWILYYHGFGTTFEDNIALTEQGGYFLPVNG